MNVQTPFIAGNWKMHLTPSEAREFVQRFLPQLSGAEAGTIALFPSALAFAAVHDELQGSDRVQLGVQNVHWEANGAFTGESSAGMAADAGASFVLVGHSERRHVFGETSEDTRRKVEAVLEAGMTPLLCVGETLEEREAGRARDVVESQLQAVFSGEQSSLAAGVVIAYEPVWAIGTGRTASPADAAEMHAAIRTWLGSVARDEAAARIPILYGGSVKPDNAGELLATPNVDGVLVGGASLDPGSFARIWEASREARAS